MQTPRLPFVCVETTITKLLIGIFLLENWQNGPFQVA